MDPGFGSSPTGLVLCEHLKDHDKIIVRQTETFTKSDPNYIKDVCFDLHRKYWNLWFICDSSNRAFLNLLKVAFGESLNWDPKKVSPNNMRVIPISFNKDHSTMLQHLHLMINKQYLAIPEKHHDLIVSLRTAQAIIYSLDKQRTRRSDLLDSFRLSFKGYNIR